MTLGQKIRELRKSKFMTQKELAERIGVQFTYLSKVENDVKGATLRREKLVKVAEILEGDPDELVKLAGKQDEGVPPSIESMVKENKAAYEFLRTASRKKISAQKWRELKKYLEDNEKQ